MNDFDSLLRSALLEAQAKRWETVVEVGPELTWVPERRRTMERLYRDPFGYGKRRVRPLWRRAMGRAAQIAVSLLLAGALTFTFSPEARAWGIRLLRQWFPTYTDYIFAPGERGGAAIWRPAYVPEGYTLTDAFEPVYGAGDLTYENEDGGYIVFSYTTAKEGAGFGIDNEHSDLTTTYVDGIPADLYISNADGWPNYLIWISKDEEAAFCLMSEVPEEALIEMAESVEKTG